jgi:hypothetical protein
VVKKQVIELAETGERERRDAFGGRTEPKFSP